METFTDMLGGLYPRQSQIPSSSWPRLTHRFPSCKTTFKQITFKPLSSISDLPKSIIHFITQNRSIFVKVLKALTVPKLLKKKKKHKCSFFQGSGIAYLWALVRKTIYVLIIYTGRSWHAHAQKEECRHKREIFSEDKNQFCSSWGSW